MECIKDTLEESKRAADLQDSPCTKKLRCGEPDLKVILKYTDEEDNAAEKVYPMYGPNLARISNFIDTSLSVEMKEKSTREIVFQDVTPNTFGKALNFVQNPLASRSMTVEDAVELVEFYDKYEFVGGLELCDELVMEYFLKHDANNLEKSFPDNLDLFVGAVVLAKNHSMPKAVMHGISFLKANFEADPDNPFGTLPLNTNHLTMLEPLFKEKILRLPDGIVAEDMGSPYAIKFYLKCRATHFLSKMLKGFRLWDESSEWSAASYSLPGGIRVRGICPQDGIKKTYTFEKISATMEWTITQKFGGISRPLWACPRSSEMEYPPWGPWIPIDDLAGGKRPVIDYTG